MSKDFDVCRSNTLGVSQFCCGQPAVCANSGPCIFRAAYREEAKNTDVQTKINAATQGSEDSKAMPANPKQVYGDTKVPLHLFPTTAVALGSMAFLEGREKYGQDNFRGAPIEVMTYVRAAMSHINLYAEGEWNPSDTPVPHLGLALACVALLIDAHYAGSLIDNRKYPGGYTKALAEMQPLVQQIRDQHADKNPKHYTIADGNRTVGV